MIQMYMLFLQGGLSASDLLVLAATVTGTYIFKVNKMNIIRF